MVPGRYPEASNSYVLLNDGKGKFSDRTQDVAKEIADIGMVTDVRWADLDNDGKNELVVVGDWMPISIFTIKNGMLQNDTPHYFGEKIYWVVEYS